MTLKALRASLADELTQAGIFTYPYPAQADSAPCGLITPGTPFITAAQVFTDVTVRFELWLLVDTEDDEALDEMVSTALTALAGGYDIESIEIRPAIDDTSIVEGAKITLTLEVGKEEI
jgi:hypothetical protein